MLHGSGNTEITEFETGLLTEKQIARFNISVDDVLAFTGFQRPADIDSQTDDILTAHCLHAFPDCL